MMGRAIFITGTDTGVGKTFFTCALALMLRDNGFQVGVMKPAETGCAERDGALFPEDAWRLKRASACAEPIETICPYRLSEPLAPSIAAERAGVKIDIDHLLDSFAALNSKYDITLVEGAGGLMVHARARLALEHSSLVLEPRLDIGAADVLAVINQPFRTPEAASR